MTGPRPMELSMNRIVFRKCIKVMVVLISYLTVLHIMKLVRISVICSLTGVCLRLQAMPNMQRSLRLPFTIVC